MTIQIEVHYRDASGQVHIVTGPNDGSVKVPTESTIDQVLPICEMPDETLTAVLINGSAITFHGGDGNITSIAHEDFYKQKPADEPTYTEFEEGERQALIEVRSFIAKRGLKEVDTFCAQRLADIKADARHRL